MAEPFSLRRLFARRKPPAAKDRFPYSLKAREWEQLRSLVESPAWASYRALLEHYGTLRAEKLLTPLTPDQTNIERGAVAALFEIAALPELLISHYEDIKNAERQRAADARERATEHEGHKFHWQWGNDLFSDNFKR